MLGYLGVFLVMCMRVCAVLGYSSCDACVCVCCLGVLVVCMCVCACDVGVFGCACVYA